MMEMKVPGREGEGERKTPEDLYTGMSCTFYTTSMSTTSYYTAEAVESDGPLT